jgi:hypothetical protein
MKKIYLFFLLLVVTFGNAQVISIPDANLKARLIALGVDTNLNDAIEQDEALAVTTLDIPSSAIASMQGIQYFTNLVHLDCSWNNFYSDAQISQLTNLTYLDVTRCSLSNLNVTGMANLTELYCNSNTLTALDVAGLTNLTKLDFGLNELYDVEFDNLTQLTYLNCALNHLSEINLSNLIHLEKLYANSNNNNVLDVSALVNLKFLYCSDSQISALNLTPLTQLEALYCNNTNVSSLDLSHMPGLTTLIVGSPSLQTLDLSAVSNLKALSLYAGQYTSIDLSNLTHLEGLDVGNQSNLTSVDVSTSPVFSSIRLFSTQTVTYVNIHTGYPIYQIHLSDSSNLMNVCCNPEDVSRVDFELSFTNTAAIHNANASCLFFPQGEHNTISGIVTFDSDGNGCDSSDLPQQNIKMNISNGANQGTAFSNANGIYQFYPQVGNFTITPAVENGSFFSFSPASITIPFLNNNNNLTAQNFCVTNNGSHNDLEIVIVPATRARPGFDATYKLVYRNKGNQVLSGNILFNYPEALADYAYSSQPLESQSSGSVSWQYENLLPFESRSLTVTLNLNGPMEIPALDVNDVIGFTAVINPVLLDETPFDNEFALRQTVVGSIDPNDKNCLEGNVIAADKIGDYLHYQINFENIGTAAAEFIVVKDAIDASKFDVASLQVVNASHPVVSRMTANNVEFRFENINLGTQQHGYVVFKIKTKNNLTIGSTVSNKADIFFDYNFPIATNTATSVFQLLKTTQFEIDNSVRISPNPAQNVITVKANGNIKTIQLFDAQGRVIEVKRIDAVQSDIDISNYARGIYFLKVATQKGTKSEKIIKE